MRGTLAILVAALLVTAAPARAAVGLLAPPPHVNGFPQPVRLLPQPGLLIDPNTRIPGLIAPATPKNELRVRADSDARAHVRSLQRRLHEARDARAAANVVVGVVLGLLALAAVATRNGLLARAAVLYAPAALSLGLAFRAWWAIGLGALALALASAVPARAFRPLLLLFFLAALVVLRQWPGTNALATIGPHPDGGGRFYGVTNQVETMLLAPALAAGLAAAPLALVAVGWSEAGADGGGLLVYAAAYAVAVLGVTRRRLALALGAAVVLGLLLVALDAAAGGSSHVTNAVGAGLPGDLAHRWRVSWDGATRSAGTVVQLAGGLALLAAAAVARPRRRLVDAFLVALLVSFAVNDTPQDVALWGGLGALALLGFERARVR